MDKPNNSCENNRLMRFLLYLLTFLIACSNDESMIKNFIQDNNLPFEEMKEVSLLETNDGKKNLIIC